MLLQMACRRDPSNAAAFTKLAQARQLRARAQPTLPSTWAEELQYNTHLRASVEELAQLCGAA